MSYHHLTIEERACIGVYFKENKSITEIANLLHRSKATISRELRRNNSRDEGYNPIGAQRKYNVRRRKCVRETLLLTNKKLYDKVCAGLALTWSPEEIVNRLPAKWKICASTIYRGVKKKIIPKDYSANLRHYNKQYRRKTTTSQAYDFSQVRTISQRPPSVANRNRYGHWELDTIVLRPECNCHLATFVERKSRLVLIRKIANKKAKTMSDTIIEAFRNIPEKYRKTFTVDRGLEFTDWQRVEKELGVKVYFCDPYSPQQRGTNENTNGLIRQFFPRRTLLPEITYDLVQSVQMLINTRPRKVLKWRASFSLLHLA